MGRAEMLARMDSRELTGWMALLFVQDDERQAAEALARMKADSDDGEVLMFGTPPSAFDDDDDEV